MKLAACAFALASSLAVAMAAPPPAVPEGFHLEPKSALDDVFGDASAYRRVVDRFASIADQMQQWLEGAGCDGFNVMFPYLPGGLDDFVDSVVPELQRRGIFRTAYEGATLRENLGLPRPANRFFTES